MREAQTGASSYDVVVVGSGAGGFTAALAASSRGLAVLILEKTSHVGGTTTRSGGGMWVPCNPCQERAGEGDSTELARAYIESCAGEYFDAIATDTFLKNAPKMVRFLESETTIRLQPAPRYSDYRPEKAGSKSGWRPVFPQPFDGRMLGRSLGKLGRPLPELTLLGMQIGDAKAFGHFLKARTSPRSAMYVAGRLVKQAYEYVRYGRAAQQSSGAALIAHLFHAAEQRGIDIRIDAEVAELVSDQHRVAGIRLGSGEFIEAKRGVILATGGFPHDLERRMKVYGHAADELHHRSAAPATNTGDGIRMGERAGAHFDSRLSNAAAWAPVSLLPRRDGSVAVFPHFLDRAKPGRIAVTRSGKRFCNEANSYHHFCQSMARACADKPEIAAYLITDRPSLRRYGFGPARPAPFPYHRLIRCGYLTEADTLEGLAGKLNLEPKQFMETIREFNEGARRGEDPLFGRGANPYNLYYGDRRNKPNPCVGPIETAPFYAIKMIIGDLGTFAGLSVNENAQVLTRDGEPIPGLFAAGNDARTVFGGDYVGGGSTLGPGMTYGYVAGSAV